MTSQATRNSTAFRRHGHQRHAGNQQARSSQWLPRLRAGPPAAPSLPGPVASRGMAAAAVAADTVPGRPEIPAPNTAQTAPRQ